MLRKRRQTRTYLDLAAGVAGNPSSPHAEGRAAKKMIEDARTRIARLVECKPDDILFTSGATESNALAILGALRAARTAGNAHPHALYWPGSHASIIENMRLAASEGAVVEELPVAGGRIDVARLSKMLRPETALVSLEAVDGETGLVWNTGDIGKLLHLVCDIAESPLLHVDASQAPWTEKLTRAHFGADLLTFDLSKVSPERGAGCLVAPRTIPLTPLYRGGGQERGVRSGTQAPQLAAALAEALKKCAAGRAAFVKDAAQDRTALVARITESIRGILVNEGPSQAPNIVNISLPGRDTDYLLALLDDAGYSVSTRSACESDSAAGSRAVFALTGDEERSRSTLRISWGPGTNAKDLMRFADALASSVAFVDKGGST